MAALAQLKRKMNSYISEREHLWLSYVIIFAAFVEGMALISGILSQRLVYESFLFTVYQVVAILIPGLAYVELLKVKFCTTGTARVLLAYAVGYGSNIVIYYILFWIGKNQNNQMAVWVCLLVQFLLSVSILIKKKAKYCETQSVFFMVPVFIGVMFAIELFTYCGNNMMPPYTDAGDVVKDLVYWIGNSIALKQDYPPVDFRTLREGYGYHFFSSIQIAMASMATKLDVLTYSICYSYIQAIIVMVGGFYCLLEKQISKKSYMLFLFVVFFLLSGYEDITRTNWSMHIWACPFGFDYGLGLMLFLLLIINEFFMNEFSYTNFILLNFIFAILMGVKSPFACIGIIGIGIGCFYELLRKDWKKSIGEGCVILLIFGCIYYFVVNIKGYRGEDITNTIPLGVRTWDESIELGEMRNRVMSIPFVPQILKELLFFCGYIFLGHPCLILCAISSGFMRKKEKCRIDWSDVAFLGMFLTGMGIGLYLFMNGGSQVYFVCATYPVLLFWLSRGFKNNKTFNPIKYKILAICLILWGGWLTIAHPAWQPMIGYASVGRYNFKDAQQGKWVGDGYVSQSECEILEYVKENISKNKAILFVNERDPSEDRYSIGGVIAEHILHTVNRVNISSRSDLNEYLMQDYDFCIMKDDLLTMDDDIVFENEDWALIKVEKSQECK